MADKKRKATTQAAGNKEQNKKKKIKGHLVNDLSAKEVNQIVSWMKTNKIPKKGCHYLEERERGWICNLVSTTTKKGEPKYPQIDISRFNFAVTGKVLVHHIFWRNNNNGALVDLDPNMHISHIDKDKKYVNCVQETKDMNESRKFCHLFKWYKKKPGEERSRCPHWESPCTGPND